MATVLTDLPTGLACRLLLPPNLYADDYEGPACDMVDGDGPAFALLMTGDPDPGTSAVVHLEESADGATGWAAIPGAAFPTVTEPGKVLLVRFRRSARYVRAVLDLDGVSTLYGLTVLAGQQAKAT